MYSKLKTARCRTGFTLIEVITASLLLVVVMVPILKSLSAAHASTVKLERKTRSLILAQAKLDQIKARSIYNYTNDGASFAETNTPVGGSYLCNVTDDSGDPLKKITVSVGFDADGNGSLSAGEVEVTLATLMARRWVD
jgi:Tfp pilus assembly protein PilV